MQWNKNKSMVSQRSCISLWSRSLPKPSNMGGTVWLYNWGFWHRILRVLILQHWRSFIRWSTRDLKPHAINTPCSGLKLTYQLPLFCCSRSVLAALATFTIRATVSASPAIIWQVLKKLISKSKFSQHSCKCCAVNAACAGLPCMLLTVTVSALPAWGFPTRKPPSRRRIVLTARTWYSPLCTCR